MTRAAISGAVVFALATAVACASEPPANPSDRAEMRLLARLADARIVESSGLAVSRIHADILWTHNDSGGEARLFAFDHSGADRGSCAVRGATNLDWEDLAAFTLDGASYLGIADTGNQPASRAGRVATRRSYAIVVVAEPSVDPVTLRVSPEADVAATVTFAYEDGSRDCEAMAIDGHERAAYLMAKTVGFSSEVYRLPLVFDAPGTPPKTARPVCRSPVTVATAMDLSRDGRRAAVLTYLGIAVFARSEGESWQRAFRRQPGWIHLERVPLMEAVAFTADGGALLVTAELHPGGPDRAPLYVVSMPPD
jgi:hypothetical protein